jgi:hypothetical protein
MPSLRKDALAVVLGAVYGVMGGRWPGKRRGWGVNLIP